MNSLGLEEQLSDLRKCINPRHPLFLYVASGQDGMLGVRFYLLNSSTVQKRALAQARASSNEANVTWRESLPFSHRPSRLFVARDRSHVCGHAGMSVGRSPLLHHDNQLTYLSKRSPRAYSLAFPTCIIYFPYFCKRRLERPGFAPDNQA